MRKARVEIVGDAKSFIAAIGRANTSLTSFERNLTKLQTTSAAVSTASNPQQLQQQQALWLAMNQQVAKSARGSKELSAQQAAIGASAATSTMKGVKGWTAYGDAMNKVKQAAKSTPPPEHHVQMGRTVRGALAGAGAFTTLGRSIAYASTSFLAFAVVSGVVRSAVASAAAFSESLSHLEGLASVAHNKIAGLGEAILRMSTQVGIGPTDLADALYLIASGGIKATKQLNVLRLAAMASASGIGDVKTVALAITSAMNAYGQANLSAAAATNTLVNTVRLGDRAASEFAPVIGTVSSMAAALGVKFYEVGAALASMTRVGVPAQTASIQLQAIFSALLKKSEDGAKALRDVGLSYSGLVQQLKGHGLLSVLFTLQTAFKGNVEQMQRVFTNVRAVRGALGILGKHVKETIDIFAKMATTSKTALAHAFAVAQQDPAFRFRKFQAVLQALQITIGSALLPTITSVGDALGGWLSKKGNIEKLNSTIQDTAKAIGDVFKAIKSLATPFTALAHASNSVLGGWDKTLKALILGFFVFKSRAVFALSSVEQAAIQALKPLNKGGRGLTIAQLKTEDEERAKSGGPQLMNTRAARLIQTKRWAQETVAANTAVAKAAYRSGVVQAAAMGGMVGAAKKVTEAERGLMAQQSAAAAKAIEFYGPQIEGQYAVAAAVDKTSAAYLRGEAFAKGMAAKQVAAAAAAAKAAETQAAAVTTVAERQSRIQGMAVGTTTVRGEERTQLKSEGKFAGTVRPAFTAPGATPVIFPQGAFAAEKAALAAEKTGVAAIAAEYKQVAASVATVVEEVNVLTAAEGNAERAALSAAEASAVRQRSVQNLIAGPTTVRGEERIGLQRGSKFTGTVRGAFSGGGMTQPVIFPRGSFEGAERVTTQVSKMNGVLHGLGNVSKVEFTRMTRGAQAAATGIGSAFVGMSLKVGIALKTMLISTGWLALMVLAGIAAQYVIEHWSKVKGWFAEFWTLLKVNAKATWNVVVGSLKVAMGSVLTYILLPLRVILEVLSKIPKKFGGGHFKGMLADVKSVTAGLVNQGLAQTVSGAESYGSRAGEKYGEGFAKAMKRRLGKSFDFEPLPAPAETAARRGEEAVTRPKGAGLAPFVSAATATGAFVGAKGKLQAKWQLGTDGTLYAMVNGKVVIRVAAPPKGFVDAGYQILAELAKHPATKPADAMNAYREQLAKLLKPFTPANLGKRAALGFIPGSSDQFQQPLGFQFAQAQAAAFGNKAKQIKVAKAYRDWLVTLIRTSGLTQEQAIAAMNALTDTKNTLKSLQKEKTDEKQFEIPNTAAMPLQFKEAKAAAEGSKQDQLAIEIRIRDYILGIIKAGKGGLVFLTQAEQSLKSYNDQIKQLQQSQFEIPVGLQFKEAKADAEGSKGDQLAIARRIRDYILAIIHAGKGGLIYLIAAEQALNTYNQTIKQLTQQQFEIPMKLQLATAKAAATGTEKQQRAVAIATRKAIRAQLASGKLEGQAKIDAYNELANIRSQLANKEKKSVNEHAQMLKDATQTIADAVDAARGKIGTLFQGPVLNPSERERKTVLGLPGPDVGRLTKDVMGQTNQFLKFDSEINRFKTKAGKVIPKAELQGVVKELEELGPAAMPELEAILKASPRKFRKLVQALGRREAVAEKAALIQLQSDKVNMFARSVAIQLTNKQLKSFTNTGTLPKDQDIHVHTYLDGKEIARSTTTRQQRDGRRHAAQRRGRLGGINLGLS